MGPITIDIERVQVFLLIFLRISSVLFLLPVFDSRNIPIVFKIGLALGVSFLAFNTLKLNSHPLDLKMFFAAAGGEVMLGAAIGLAVKFLFGALQLAGQMAGYQMGLGIANVLDPVSNEQVPLLGQLHTLTGLMVFLAIDAHHWLIRALVASFTAAPPLDFFIGTPLVGHLVRLSSVMFITAVKVAAPVMAALLLTAIAMALAARTVPQMNVFIVAFPLKIIVGLVFSAFALPYLTVFLTTAFKSLASDMIVIIKAASVMH
jgi:flagellar biosynthetic protein FliR